MQQLQHRRSEIERRRESNGGFPEPPSGEAVRVVRSSHRTCGAETRIRLPEGLPSRVVHRVVCEGCQETYSSTATAGTERVTLGPMVVPEVPKPTQPPPAEVRVDAEPVAAAPPPEADAGADAVEAVQVATVVAAAAEAESAEPPAAADVHSDSPNNGRPGRARAVLASILGPRRRPETAPAAPESPAVATDEAAPADAGRRRLSLPQIPRTRLWAWASVPLATLGVIAGLVLIQGNSSNPATEPAATAIEPGSGAKFIEQPGYSLALPAGWKKVNPPTGAVFAAEAGDGSADATLWIEEDPDLSMREFEERSLSQLAQIADNAAVIDRVDAPTIEGSIVELRADAPIAEGVTSPYRVTLRGAGPFRHYLATSEQPGAGPQIAADIELLHGSLRPDVQLAGVAEGSGIGG